MTASRPAATGLEGRAPAEIGAGRSSDSLESRMSSLRDPRVESVLKRLRTAAAGDAGRSAQVSSASAARELEPIARAQERAEIYMAIAPVTGSLCYQLIRAARPELVVEFGTSYGVSTLYLAAAVRDNGRGRVVTTELSHTKTKAATENLVDAGLDEHVTVLDGDARQTLVEISEPVGFLFLDGWKELYLPVLQLLEPRLEVGAVVVADDASFESLDGYRNYVRDPENGYESAALAVDDGIELSSRMRQGIVGGLSG